MSTVGIDLGGTNLRGLLMPATGEPGAVRKTRVGQQRDPEAVVARVAALAQELMDEAPRDDPVAAVGVGVAGWVRPSDGAVVKAPNLGWADVPLKALLEAALAVPVLPMNDLSAVAYGEWKVGAARGASDVLVVFGGTGVGGGLIVGGRLQEGNGGFAGEIGHIPVVYDGGRACGCGGAGCLETVAGGVHIEARLREGATAGRFGQILALAGGEADGITCAHAERAAAAGDSEALALWDEVGRVLGSTLAGLINTLDSGVLVLGGGVLEGCPLLRGRVEVALRSRLLPPISEGLRVLGPTLGDPAGVIGAATRARDELE